MGRQTEPPQLEKYLNRLGPVEKNRGRCWKLQYVVLNKVERSCNARIVCINLWVENWRTARPASQGRKFARPVNVKEWRKRKGKFCMEKCQDSTVSMKKTVQMPVLIEKWTQNKKDEKKTCSVQTRIRLGEWKGVKGSNTKLDTPRALVFANNLGSEVYQRGPEKIAKSVPFRFGSWSIPRDSLAGVLMLRPHSAGERE